MLEQWVNRSWYGRFQWTWLFWPLMLLYRFVVQRKRTGFLTSPPPKVAMPVVVVGNITVGGTGKTPVVQSVVRRLLKEGYRPAIITRGYGGSVQAFPHIIQTDDTPANVGDEPFMMASSLNVPVVVDPKRSRAAQYCLDELDVDVIISDDGLQHYALNRDIEICVVDAKREFGNGQLMPVGPLREPLERLNAVDFVLRNGCNSKNGFILAPVNWVNLKNGESLSPEAFHTQIRAKISKSEQNIKAIAGIGNPQRFFDEVTDQGIEAECQPFPDHHDYVESDFDSNTLYLMTHKDAVKINTFSTGNMWYLDVSANLPQDMMDQLVLKLNVLRRQTNG